MAKISISSQIMDTVIAEVTKKINGKTKQGWWGQLMDKTNDNVSSSTFIVVLLVIAGLLLLLVPVFTLCVEAWYTHTISTSLTGMAAYIGAVTSIFTVAACLKGWVSRNDMKQKIAEIEHTAGIEVTNCADEIEA